MIKMGSGDDRNAVYDCFLFRVSVNSHTQCKKGFINIIHEHIVLLFVTHLLKVSVAHYLITITKCLLDRK